MTRGVSDITAVVTLIAPARTVVKAGTTGGAVARSAISTPGRARVAEEVLEFEVDTVAALIGSLVVLDTSVDVVDGSRGNVVVVAVGISALGAQSGRVGAGAEVEVRRRAVETCTTTDGDIVILAGGGHIAVLEAPDTARDSRRDKEGVGVRRGALLREIIVGTTITDRRHGLAESESSEASNNEKSSHVKIKIEKKKNQKKEI